MIQLINILLIDTIEHIIIMKQAETQDTSHNDGLSINMSNAVDINVELRNRVRAGDIAGTRKLLDQGADVNYYHVLSFEQQNQYPRNSSTALAIALEFTIHDEQYNQNEQIINAQINQDEYLEMIELLLKYGANPNRCKLNKQRQRKYRKKSTIQILASYLYKLHEQRNKIKFVEMFMKQGINLSNKRLLFDILDAHGQSKIKQLSKMCKQNFDFEVLYQSRSQKLLKQFYEMQGFTNEQYQMDLQGERIRRRRQQILMRLQSIQQLDLIKTVIVNGKCSNAVKSEHRDMTIAEQQHPDRDQSDSLQQLSDHQDAYIDRGYKEYVETALHRAIMYNSAQLVKFLIDHNADPTVNCIYPIRLPVYPHEWSERARSRKIRKNQQYLKTLEQQRQQVIQSIRVADFGDGNGRRRQRSVQQQKQLLNQYNLKIFKAQCFKIENEPPEYTYSSRIITCLQLAKFFKASEQIVSMLQESIQKIQQRNQQKRQLLENE